MNKRRIGTRTGIGMAALAFAAFAAAPAHADTIDISADLANSSQGVGDFEGTIDYSYDGLFGTLVVTLTNTTDAQEGGFLTAIAFDSGGDVTLSNYQTDTGMNSLAGLDAPPFNGAGGPFYEHGAAVGSLWLNTGTPADGVANGDTGTWSWTVAGPDAATMTAIDFLDAGEKTFGFVVRFRGLASVGHDKTPAQAAQVVPLPAPVALGALGLIGAAVGSRRMRRQAQATG